MITIEITGFVIILTLFGYSLYFQLHSNCNYGNLPCIILSYSGLLLLFILVGEIRKWTIKSRHYIYDHVTYRPFIELLKFVVFLIWTGWFGITVNNLPTYIVSQCRYFILSLILTWVLLSCHSIFEVVTRVVQVQFCRCYLHIHTPHDMSKIHQIDHGRTYEKLCTEPDSL